MRSVYISGLGCTIPEERLTNQQLVSELDTSEDWIDAHTGILERRRAPAEVDTSDLGVAATRRALEARGWQGEDLELLVCATCTPDAQAPSTAAIIGHKMGIDPVSFDLNAACSGFVFGLAAATSMVAQLGFGRAALCNAEKFTKVTDYRDRGSAIFFGDSAATVLLQAERPERGFEVVDLVLASRNEGVEHVRVPMGGYFRQDGRKVKDCAICGFFDSASEILGRNELAPSQLRAFVGHQANFRLLEQIAKGLGITDEQHWHNVRWVGNQGSAGVVTTFCTKVEEQASSFVPGDLFLLTVFGAGFTSGSVLLRWVDQGAEAREGVRGGIPAGAPQRATPPTAH